MAQRVDRTPARIFNGMASPHGETIGFVIDDLLALPVDRQGQLDWFGNLPQSIAPLLSWPEQAVFLLSTNDFRRAALTTPLRRPGPGPCHLGRCRP
jgi:hypothetical protein